MAMNIDRTPRYVPQSILARVQGGGWAEQPVLQVVSYPPRKHPEGCPLRPECTAVELKTHWSSRWFGFEEAHINSELRMVVSGFSADDEVRMKWEVCTTP